MTIAIPSDKQKTCFNSVFHAYLVKFYDTGGPVIQYLAYLQTITILKRELPLDANTFRL